MASKKLNAFFSLWLLNESMKTTDEIRLAKLKELIAKHGGLKRFCAEYGRSEAQVSQWTTQSANSKTGKPRNIGTASCRSIEKHFGLPSGWFDVPDGMNWPFKTISAASYDLLSHEQKDKIEAYIQGFIDSVDGSKVIQLNQNVQKISS